MEKTDLIRTGCKNINVIISHPHGDIEASIDTWLQNGPGIRKYVTVTSVICVETKEKLSPSVIPLRYRNNRLSRFLIFIGLLQNPWHD